MNLLFTTIILIAITTIAFYLDKRFDRHFNYLGSNLSTIVGIVGMSLLTMHILFWIFRDSDYKSLVIEREILNNTLSESRKIENNLESAAILKDVMDFNISLSKMKYYNKSFILGQYVDDRVEGVEPIK